MAGLTTAGYLNTYSVLLLRFAVWWLLEFMSLNARGVMKLSWGRMV
jgi:hypothetical protein